MHIYIYDIIEQYCVHIYMSDKFKLSLSLFLCFQKNILDFFFFLSRFLTLSLNNMHVLQHKIDED